MKIGMLPAVSGASVSSAVQVDVSGEISALTAKTTPVAADIMMIEDSAASNAKKKMALSNLLAGSIASATTVVNCNAATAPTAGQVLTATSTTAATWQTQPYVKMGSHTVAGAAVQSLMVGAGGASGTTSATFAAGYRYRIECRVVPTTAATTHAFDLQPQELTTNMVSRYLSGVGTTEETDAVASGVFAGSANDTEEYIFRIEWNEMAGFDRHITVTVIDYDASVPAVYSIKTHHVIWAQTPGETALTKFKVNSDQADGFGIGSYIAVFRDGEC